MLGRIDKTLGITAIQFAANQSLLAIAEPNRVRIVSVPDGQLRHAINTHGLTKCFVMRRDAQTLYCATDAGVVDVCDLAHGVVSGSIPLHLQRMTDIAVSTDGRYLMTSSDDRTAVILDLKEGNPTEPFDRVLLPDGEIRSVAVNPQAAKVAIAVNSGEQSHVFVRDIDGDQREVRLPRGHRHPLIGWCSRSMVIIWPWIARRITSRMRFGGSQATNPFSCRSARGFNRLPTLSRTTITR